MAISSIELRRGPTASDIALLTATTRSTLAAITCACQALMPEPSSDSATRVPKPKASRWATDMFLRLGSLDIGRVPEYSLKNRHRRPQLELKLTCRMGPFASTVMSFRD